MAALRSHFRSGYVPYVSFVKPSWIIPVTSERRARRANRTKEQTTAHAVLRSSTLAAQRLRERSNATILEDGIFQQIIKRVCISTIPLNLTCGNTSESGCNLVRPQPFLVLFRADERKRLRIRSHSKCSNKSPAPVSSPTSLYTKP